MVSHSGEWHDYRGDDTRLGRQALPGSGGRLQLQASYSIGGGFQEMLAVGDGSGDILMADGGGIQRVDPNGKFRWRTPPFGAHWITGVFDLDADGHLELLTSNGREVIILSAESGEILFRDTVGPPFSYGTYATMFQVHSFFGAGMQILVPCFSHKEVLMYDCSQGARNTRILHKLWMDDGYHPSITIADVNSDGADEIVIARLGGVYVFDAESGQLASQTIWKSDEERRRNYGHFELADIDGDGILEAIILSDKVTRHVAVLGNNGDGNFYPLWDRLIEHIYPNDTTELRYTSNSVRDFDADGKLEIAVSIFNVKGDNTWHTQILKAETGECVLDLPRKYLRGVQEINGNANLCLSDEPARAVRNSSTLSIYSPALNKELWTIDNSSFCERAVRPQPRSFEFKPDVFAHHEIWSGPFEGRSGILLRQPEGLAILDSDLSVRPLNYHAKDNYKIALLENNRVLISEQDGRIVQLKVGLTTPFLSTGYHLTTEAHISSRPGPSATTASLNEQKHVALPDFSNRIHVLRNSARKLEPVLKILGRSRLGYDGVFHAASVIVTSQGPRLIIVDDAGLKHSRISLFDFNGNRSRSYEFSGMPASMPGNRIGCYDWLYFQHSRGEALFASFYQSPSMNSECSLAFLLETGEVLWRKERTGLGEYGRGIGPWGTAALYIKNGKSIAIFCAKDTLCHLDLESGEFLHPPKLLTDFTADTMRASGTFHEQSLSTNSSIEDPFTAYGTPIVCGEDLVIGGCFGGFGVLDKDLNAKWWHVASFGDVLYRLPGIGDIDGDTTLEFGQSHADGTFRVYNYLSGDIRETIDLQTIATDVLTCDVNNDGNPEFVMGTNDGRLLIIGHDGSKFGILEEYQANAALGSPIAADIDGDGISEILVVSAAGELLSFK
jgi:hypothetical protein